MKSITLKRKFLEHDIEKINGRIKTLEDSSLLFRKECTRKISILLKRRNGLEKKIGGDK